MVIKFENYNEFPDLILVRKFSGEVEVDSIIESWKFLIENNLIKKTHLGVINDLTNCELLMNNKGFSTLTDYLINQEILKPLKLAVICNSPNKIIFPILGEKDVKELKIKPFYTLEAAVDWIVNMP